MFRIPSLGEFLALFHAPRTVSAAIASIERAAQRAEDVIAHCTARAGQLASKAEDWASLAAEAEAKAVVARAEAVRARRVSEKLKELVA